MFTKRKQGVRGEAAEQVPEGLHPGAGKRSARQLLQRAHDVRQLRPQLLSPRRSFCHLLAPLALSACTRANSYPILSFLFIIAKAAVLQCHKLLGKEGPGKAPFCQQRGRVLKKSSDNEQKCGASM